MKGPALSYHVDDRRHEGDGVADRGRLLRILGETEEGEEEYVGRGGYAHDDGEYRRHTERLGDVLQVFPSSGMLNSKTSRRQDSEGVSDVKVQSGSKGLGGGSIEQKNLARRLVQQVLIVVV